MSTIAKVKSYMTPSPYTIGAEQLVAHAKELFLAHGIRHLPVLRGGSLEGVLSDRDIALIDRLDVNADRLTVDDVMTSDVYQVAPDTSLAEVARDGRPQARICDRRRSPQGDRHRHHRRSV